MVFSDSDRFLFGRPLRLPLVPHELRFVPVVGLEQGGADGSRQARITNPIESTFATVHLRTTKTKGCLSRMTALTMVFKLCQSASKKWRRRDGSHQIADIIQGVKFKDGEKLTERAT